MGLFDALRRYLQLILVYKKEKEEVYCGII